MLASQGLKAFEVLPPLVVNCYLMRWELFFQFTEKETEAQKLNILIPLQYRVHPSVASSSVWAQLVCYRDVSGVCVFEQYESCQSSEL